MPTNVKILHDKLLYFAEIGEVYRVELEEIAELVRLLNTNNTKRRFKVSYSETGNYAVIWRNK